MTKEIHIENGTNKIRWTVNPFFHAKSEIPIVAKYPLKDVVIVIGGD